MSRRSIGGVLILLAVMLAGSQLATAALINGSVATDPMDDPPITVGAGWWATTVAPPAFFWGSSGWNNEGPFTFNHPTFVDVYVTDDFMKGDRFEVYDFGVSIGLTSLVPTVSGVEVGPDAAYADPTYGSGVFTLPPGAHSITLFAIQNPYTVGRGYLKVEEADYIPEPTTLALLSLGALGVVRARRRKRR